MELEAVGRVPVRNLRLEIRGQIDDVDGIEGTFLGTDAASDAQAFGNEGDLAARVDFDAELPRPHHGAALLTFLQQTRLGRMVEGVAIPFGERTCRHFFGLPLESRLARCPQ